MAKFEIYEDEAGEWRWRLRADNGEIVATSEGYATKQNAERGVGDAKESGFATRDTEVIHVEGRD